MIKNFQIQNRRVERSVPVNIFYWQVNVEKSEPNGREVTHHYNQRTNTSTFCSRCLPANSGLAVKIFIEQIFV